MADKKSVRGALFLLLSAVVWSFSGVLSKGIQWSGFSKTGVRGIVAVLIYAVSRRTFRVKLTLGNVLGGLGVCVTCFLYMTALNLTTSANAIVLQYSMPIFVVLISWLLFKQKPTLIDIGAVALVALGVVLCCVQGLSGGAFTGDMIALASGLSYAVVFLASKLPNTDAVSYTYLGNCFTVLFTVSIFFDPGVHFVPTADITGSMVCKEWLTMLLMGLSLGFGYLFFAYGIRETGPVTAAILSNVEPVLNPVWVFLFYRENPGIYSIIGALVVLATVTVYTCVTAKRSPGADEIAR